MRQVHTLLCTVAPSCLCLAVYSFVVALGSDGSRASWGPTYPLVRQELYAVSNLDQAPVQIPQRLKVLFTTSRSNMKGQADLFQDAWVLHRARTGRIDHPLFLAVRYQLQLRNTSVLRVKPRHSFLHSFLKR